MGAAPSTEVAIADIEKSAEAHALLRWVGSDEFFALREELGLPAR